MLSGQKSWKLKGKCHICQKHLKFQKLLGIELHIVQQFTHKSKNVQKHGSYIINTWPFLGPK